MSKSLDQKSLTSTEGSSLQESQVILGPLYNIHQAHLGACSTSMGPTPEKAWYKTGEGA